MWRFLCFLGAMAAAVAVAGDMDDDDILRRGDANSDSLVDVSDVSFISDYLFQGGPEPPCMNQADVNGDGAVNVSDCSYLTNYLFQGGPAPPAPGPDNTQCTDTSPYISCSYLICD